MQIDVPRDRDWSFEPATVNKQRRRLNGVDELVLPLTARAEERKISTHFAEVYVASVFKDTVSRVTGRVVAEMGEWQIARWARSTPCLHRRRRGQGAEPWRGGRVPRAR